MPRVSVLIPAYNAAGSIRRAVDSVLAQTYSDLEVIVVDDGSTDSTRDVLANYGDRICYIYQENQERSAARNNGIRNARGEYIAFLDSDDYWLPTKLERQMALFDEHPETGLVYSLAYSIDANGRRLAISGAVPERAVDPLKTYCRLLLGNFIPGITPVIKRACCTSVGWFDVMLSQSEDWDYWLRVAQEHPVQAVAEPLACFEVAADGRLLQKMAGRAAQTAYVRVAEKARERGGCPDSFLRLVLAQAWFIGALIDVGLDQIEEGRLRLQKALEHEPRLLSDHEDIVLNSVAALGAELCYGLSTVELGEQFIRQVWAVLPNTGHSGRQLRRALSKLHADRFFQGNRLGNHRVVRSSLWPMTVNDPRWLRNPGVWSIALRSMAKKPNHATLEL